MTFLGDINCDHNFTYAGVVYAVGDTRLPGSSVNNVHYFDHYFCTRCLDHQYEKLSHVGHTYQAILYEAKPVPKSFKKETYNVW